MRLDHMMSYDETTEYWQFFLVTDEGELTEALEAWEFATTSDEAAVAASGFERVYDCHDMWRMFSGDQESWFALMLAWMPDWWTDHLIEAFETGNDYAVYSFCDGGWKNMRWQLLDAGVDIESIWRGETRTMARVQELSGGNPAMTNVLLLMERDGVEL